MAYSISRDLTVSVKGFYFIAPKYFRMQESSIQLVSQLLSSQKVVFGNFNPFFLSNRTENQNLFIHNFAMIFCV